MELKYTNPILHFDFSDPDCIRVGNDFYMIASSFNYLPGIPLLHSKNLVEWELINYIVPKLDDYFDEVHHGEGLWAPSIRYHDGWFYAIIPDPDRGIFVTKTKDPYSKWEDMWCVIPGCGLIDPCPIWTVDKCYIAVGFAKSRIGFNSKIGLFEVSCDLKHQISETYQIVYDGVNNNPTIEGPKFNYRNGYFYIMAPAGSVKGGWQVALRSKNIYGPYESKVVLMQNGTKINGPHQGALIDLDENDNWAFIHFQDKWAYGRIVHLQPVSWHNDWPICGHCGDPLLAGAPVLEEKYPINIKTDYKINLEEDFKAGKLSLLWQTHANPKDNWFSFDDGLVLNCVQTKEKNLHLVPQLLTQKVPALEFDVETLFDLSNLKVKDKAGFTMMGQTYTFLEFECINNEYYVNLYEGSFKSNDIKIQTLKIDSNIVKVELLTRNEAIYDLKYQYKINGNTFGGAYYASAGRWIGSTYGVYAKGNGGSAKIKYFNTKVIK